MVFERSTGMACLCLCILFVLSAASCQAATVKVHLASNGTPLASGAPAVLVNGSPAGYLGNGTYSADVDAGDNSTVVATASYNGFDVTGNATLRGGQADAWLDMPGKYVEYVVEGTIYSVSADGRRPWQGGNISVLVDGLPATVDGSNYSAVLSAPEDGDAVSVKAVDDCGHALGNATGNVRLSNGSAGIDIEAPALEISGDIYAGDLPTDGAALFVYVNDRPYGPITAAAGRGPMFSLSLPDGRPGDHVSITAAKGGLSGMVSQDATGYRMFLTINLKSAYAPYADAVMPVRPAKMPAGAPRDEKENCGSGAVDIRGEMLIHHVL